MPNSRWREIEADLRRQIESGSLAPGAQLPFEVDLATQYEVQRNTVRKALAELVADGLLTRRRKGGTFVRDRDPVRVPFTVYQQATDPGRDSTLGPWETACANLGIDGRTDHADFQIMSATEPVASRLSIEVGASVARRTRHMFANNVLAQFAHAYLPMDVVGKTRLAKPGKIVGGAHAALFAVGIIPTTCRIECTGRNATSDERDLLNLGPGIPVLETWRVTTDQDGRKVELLQTVSAAETVLHVFEDLPLRSQP